MEIIKNRIKDLTKLNFSFDNIVDILCMEFSNFSINTIIRTVYIELGWDISEFD